MMILTLIISLLLKKKKSLGFTVFKNQLNLPTKPEKTCELRVNFVESLQHVIVMPMEVRILNIVSSHKGVVSNLACLLVICL